MVRYNYSWQSDDKHGDGWRGFPPHLSMQIYNAQTRGASVFQTTLPEQKNSGVDRQVEFRFDEAATSPQCPQVPWTGIIMVGMRSGMTHIVKREIAKNTNAEMVNSTLRRMSGRFRRRGSNVEAMPARLPAPKYAPKTNASKTFASRKSITTWRKMSLKADDAGADGSLSWGLYLSHAKKKLAALEAEADNGRAERRQDGFRKPKANGGGKKSVRYRARARGGAERFAVSVSSAAHAPPRSSHPTSAPALASSYQRAPRRVGGVFA